MPSEHHIDEKALAGETHFVFQSPSEKMAVVAFLFDFGSDTTKSVFDQLNTTLVHSLENKANKQYGLSSIDLRELVGLVNASEVFRYKGSLTTPPCTEGVEWTVVKNPIKMRTPLLTALRDSIDFNARPTQRTKGRQ